MERSWVEQVNKSALGLAERVAQGFHAIPKPAKDPNVFKALTKEMPSMHRLLNVLGMVGGFASTQYLSNIIFGCKINGSKYEEIKKEDVPKPLQFLCGIVPYNPFSDAPRDQWLKVLHQMLPAMGGAVGAVKGSEVFFTAINGREKDYNKWAQQDSLHPLVADATASFAQGKQWRKLAGATAWVSSATGLTVLYGVALNAAFMLCNGAKISSFKLLRTLTNNPSTQGAAPEKALSAVLEGTERTLRSGDAHGLASTLVESTIEPLKQMTEHEKEALVGKLRSVFEQNATQGATAEELAKLMKHEINETLAKTELGAVRLGDNGLLSSVVERFPGMADQLAAARRQAEAHNEPFLRS